MRRCEDKSVRIGIANPFAYRPHVGHMVFIARQLERLGHEVFFLGCGGALENCNSKVNKKGTARKLECIKCRIGGIKSYLNVEPSRIDLDVPFDAKHTDLGMELSYSTACTSLRVEHKSETLGPDFQLIQKSLIKPTTRAYLNARRWVREKRLDSVFIFNGRMDLPRAILEACRAEGVSFISVERSWFGDGVQLLPGENCLGLNNIHKLTRQWMTRPLNYGQAMAASQLIYGRLARTSVGEWRQYNIGRNSTYKKDRIKYLFLPSSQSEFLGEQNRTSGWEHPVEGIEYLFDQLCLNMSDLVIRGHPGWAMEIYSASGDRASSFYKGWAARMGAEYIDPTEKIDTQSLIRNSDMVLLNGSSAAMEIAWMGKPLASFVPAEYTSSGISVNLLCRSDIDSLCMSNIDFLRNPGQFLIDPVTQCQMALRYIYCHHYRAMQFVDSMKSIDSYKFGVSEPSDLSGLEHLVQQGALQVSDDSWDDDDADEKRVVAAVLTGDFESLLDSGCDESEVVFAPVKRRFGYHLIDVVFDMYQRKFSHHR